MMTSTLTINTVTATDAQEHLAAVIACGDAKSDAMNEPRKHFESEIRRIVDRIGRLESGDEAECYTGESVESTLAHVRQVLTWQQAYAAASPAEGPFVGAS